MDKTSCTISYYTLYSLVYNNCTICKSENCSNYIYIAVRVNRRVLYYILLEQIFVSKTGINPPRAIYEDMVLLLDGSSDIGAHTCRVKTVIRSV